MKKMKKIFALTAAFAMFSSQMQAQTNYCEPQYCNEPQYCCQDDCQEYCDSGRASYLSAALPIGALVVAAIIIATTTRHHHSSSSNRGGSGGEYGSGGSGGGDYYRSCTSGSSS